LLCLPVLLYPVRLLLWRLALLAAQPDLSCCDRDVLMEAVRIYSRNDHFKKPEAFLTHLETSANQPWSHLHSAYLCLPEKLQRNALLKQIFDQSLDLADGGDAVLQNNLGMAYYFGLGVAKDYKEAVTWYHKAAEQGLVAGPILKGYKKPVGGSWGMDETYI